MHNRRRALIAATSQGGELPSGYTRVNYLKSTGTQYIDTGIIPLSTMTEINVSSPTFISGNLTVCAAFGYNNNRYIALTQWANPETVYSQAANSSGIILSSGRDFANGEVHNIIYNNYNHKVIYDDVVKGTVTDLSNSSTRASITLFCYNAFPVTNFSKGFCIHSCTMTDKSTDTVVWNGIPALDPNNKPCMYDTVSQTPFYNLGTGEFLYG